MRSEGKFQLNLDVSHSCTQPGHSPTVILAVHLTGCSWFMVVSFRSTYCSIWFFMSRRTKRRLTSRLSTFTKQKKVESRLSSKPTRKVSLFTHTVGNSSHLLPQFLTKLSLKSPLTWYAISCYCALGNPWRIGAFRSTALDRRHVRAKNRACFGAPLGHTAFFNIHDLSWARFPVDSRWTRYSCYLALDFFIFPCCIWWPWRY